MRRRGAPTPRGWTLRARLGRLRGCRPRKIAVPMRLPHLLIALLLLGLAILPPLHAQAAGSVYSVTVPVPDTSDAQRDQAFATALAQVMTRVAGGQDLRGNPGYAEALSGASALVQKFQYQRADGSPVDEAQLASLATTAAARGTTVVYPAAGSDIDPAKVAAVDPGTLASINRQYHTGLVLLGKLHRGTADWTLISGGQVQRWSNQGATDEALLAAAGNGLVDRVGQQLNVIGSVASEGRLWVSGLESARDYADLLATLNADPSVRQVTTVGAQNQGVLLQVKASVPLAALAANLAAGGRLLLQGEPHEGADANLRWLHGVSP